MFALIMVFNMAEMWSLLAVGCRLSAGCERKQILVIVQTRRLSFQGLFWAVGNIYLEFFLTNSGNFWLDLVLLTVTKQKCIF